MINKKNQHGLSLIEIMVTLVISSVLLLAVSKVYIDNRRGYLFQQNKSENQENQRYALLLLHQHLTKAGYRRRPELTADTDQFLPAIDSHAGCPNFEKGIAVTWDKSSKSLCIRYEPRDDKDRNCLGNPPIDNTNNTLTKPYPDREYAVENIIERYWIDEGQTPPVLMCQAASDKDPTKKGGSSGQLISGIIDLRFELGVDSCSNTNDKTLKEYKKQDDDLEDCKILSIRYTALLQGSNKYVRDGSSTQDDTARINNIETALKNWINLLNIPTTDETLVKLKQDNTQGDQGQLYQVIQNTVALRNLLP